MEAEALRYFVSQGPFAVLFVWLLYSYRKDSKEREGKLYQTIDDQRDTIEKQNTMLLKFGEKYDVVIEKLDKIEQKIN